MSRVRSVAVVGRDAPLWLATAALQRALGRSDLRVHAIELDSRLSAMDVYPALPPLKSLHRLLGLEERLVLDVCNALPVVAQRFSNFAKGAPPFIVAYDDEQPKGGDLAFVQYWAKASLEGLRIGLEDFSLGSACARLNRVPITRDKPNAPSASYGYQLDARMYSELSKQLAVRLGVEVVPSGLRDVQLEGNRITSLALGDGSSVAADLYIDASGPEGQLIGRLPDARFESWREWLPCDRALSLSASALNQLPVFAQISAFNAGWIGLFPLQNRTAVSAVYSSALVNDGQAAEIARVLSRMPLNGEGIVSELRPGTQESPWIGNCIAIGGAAIAPDPIHIGELQTTHACISHLISLFPASAGEFPEREAYNSAVKSIGSNIRDFQAAHYLLNRRFDDPFWDDVRDRRMPPGLNRKVDMFAARALVPLNDDETLHQEIWTALLAGCGVTPRGFDPRVDRLTREAHMEKIRERLREIAEEARMMPSIEQFLGVDQSSAAK